MSYKVVWLKHHAKDAEAEGGLTLERAAKWHATLWREFGPMLYWCHVVDEETGRVLKAEELSGDEHLVQQVRDQQADEAALARMRAAVRIPETIREELHVRPPFPRMTDESTSAA